MKRIIIFITICLVFGAATSVAVAWWATLRDWEESDEFGALQNGWRAGMSCTPARSLIGAVPEERMGISQAGIGLPDQFRFLKRTSLPSWFSLSTKPTNWEEIIRGVGSGWPFTCMFFIQELEGYSFFPEWELVRSGGLLGVNPFNREAEYVWIRNHLPLRVVPMGLLINTLIYGGMFAFVVFAIRVILRLRANRLYRLKRCPYCKYDLSQSTADVCSECGVDPLRSQPMVSRNTNFLSGIVTTILLMALIGFSVVFSHQLPFSPIHYAAYWGDIQTVRSELTAGEDIDGIAPTYDWLELEEAAPLALACASGEIEIVAYLIDSGADIESKGWSEATSLHMALSSGSLECISLLLDNGADVNAKVIGGIDALYFLASNPMNDPSLLDILLESGYKFEPSSRFTDSAVRMAVLNDNDKLVHHLINLGAMPGFCALEGAVKKGRIDLLELFVDHGADIVVDPKPGWPLLHSLRPNNNPREVVEFLIQHGQQIDATSDYNEWTGLMYAVIRLNTDLCRILLEFGADPNLRDASGKSAIDHAIELGLGFDSEEGILSVLLEAGAEVRLVDVNGKPRFEDLDPELEKLLKEHATETKEKQSDE